LRGSREESRKNGIAAILALAATAAMFFFATGLHPVWWLTWFAIVPLLFVARRLRAARAFGVAALASFIGGLNLWHYAHAEIGIPIGIILIILGGPALVFGLTALAFRAFILRGAPGKAILVVPTLWVTYEYLNAITSPHSTFGNLGYSQMNWLPIIQIASLTGIWGISFCLFLFSATVAALLSGRAGRAHSVRLAAGVSVFLGVVLIYGARRLHASRGADNSIEVGLFGTGTEHVFPQDDKGGLELLQSYSTKIMEAAPREARVFVLPEKIAVISEEGSKQVDAIFKATAARVHATIMVGIDHGTRTLRSNEARIYSPDGKVAVYEKHHLVPGFEDVDRPGTTRTVLNEPSGVWGIEICKDMDFPHLSRKYGTDRVGLLLVPAWDFVVDGWLHGRMAILRGVEDGFTIVRAAKEGRLTVSDSRGRVLAEQNSERGGFWSLFAAAPVMHVKTFYTRWGDWFAWLNVVVLAGLLASLFRKKAAQAN
jgi:apolipoprotein N-acyltransferase